MNPGLTYYMPFGRPATATVVIAAMPATSDTVSIGAYVYTFGSNFFGSNLQEVAESLTAAINCDRNRQGLTTLKVPVRPYFAVYYGTTVVVIATEPGTGGNALTLSTSAATKFTVSGAIFTGGTGARPTQEGNVGSATGMKTAVTTGLVANSKRLYFGVINSNAAVLSLKMGTGADANSLPLAACGADDDGRGGAFFDDTYKGAVTVYNVGADYRYYVVEMETA